MFGAYSFMQLNKSSLSETGKVVSEKPVMCTPK